MPVCMHILLTSDLSQPVADNATDGFPQAQLTVVDTNPIWVYCRQANHCQQGMVFAVNPGNNFAQFQGTANGTLTNSTTTAATTTAAATGSVVTVTATVTVSGGDVVTTTYGSYPGSAEPTSASSNNHLITVGGAGKFFLSKTTCS